MKKLAIPVIVLLLVSLLVACTGNGGGNEYTGDFKEYSNSSSSQPDQVGSSSSDTSSDIVTVPLTTQPGVTVPPVSTTQPTTEVPTIDYTPIVTPDTTKPIPNTTYYNDPNTTGSTLTNILATGESTSDTTEKTTSSELKYYSIEYGDAVPTNDPSNDKVVIVRVACPSMTGDPISSSGTAVVNNVTTGKQFNAKFKVSSERVEDDDFEVKVTVGDTNVAVGDTITIEIPKGAIKTKDNKSNKKCTSLTYVFGT